MRIAFVEPHLGLFGGIRRIVELSNRLTRRGNEVTIYHPRGTPCEWMECEAAVRPSAECLAGSHDVVIYNDPNPQDFDLVRRARARLKVFFVLELYETLLLVGFHPSIYRPRHQRTRFMRKSLRASHVKLTNATWLTEWLRDRMNLKSHLVIGGINREMFYPVDVPRSLGSWRVLCSGDPRERKGTATIEQAVAIAQRTESRITLDRYHGRGVPQAEMARTYSAADLFVEASWQAGWNNPVVEAMACGVPVVCSDIGGVRDFAYHERTALLVPPRDPEETARAILRMKRDDALRLGLRDRALEHVGRFDWDESAERMETVLAHELEGRQRGVA